MEMPSGFTGDLMVALWADSFLSEPQPDELIVSNLRIPYLKSQSFFKVGLPFRVVRIGGRFDFDVTFDGRVCGLEESNSVRFTAAIHIGFLQDIISITHSGEIFSITSGEALARMATPHPTSEFAEDQARRKLTLKQMESSCFQKQREQRTRMRLVLERHAQQTPSFEHSRSQNTLYRKLTDDLFALRSGCADGRRMGDGIARL